MGSANADNLVIDKTRVKEIRLFRSGGITYKNKQSYYRIPSIVTVNKTKHVIAFAEERIGNLNHDWGDINIVYKISSDHGRTWTHRRVACEDHGDTCGNPTAVVEQQTGTIHLFMIKNSRYKRQTDKQVIEEPVPPIYEGRLSRMKAGDRSVFYKRGKVSANGNHIIWEKISGNKDERDLSEVGFGANQLGSRNIATDVIGPGAGIQLTYKMNGPRAGKHYKRLVIPANRRSFYSDDNGNTWYQSKSEVADYGESSMMELKGKVILRNDRGLFARSEYKPYRTRTLGFSLDGGASFSKDGFKDERFYDPSCHASMLRYSPREFIFANCDSNNSRSNLTLYISSGRFKYRRDPTTTHFYSNKVRVDRDCGYSSMTKTRDYHIGVLFEKDANARSAKTAMLQIKCNGVYSREGNVIVDKKTKRCYKNFNVHNPQDIVFKKIRIADFGRLKGDLRPRKTD